MNVSKNEILLVHQISKHCKDNSNISEVTANSAILYITGGNVNFKLWKNWKHLNNIKGIVISIMTPHTKKCYIESTYMCFILLNTHVQNI